MLKKCSLSNFASTCTFYFHLKTQTCVSRRKRSQMLNQLRWIVAPRVPFIWTEGCTDILRAVWEVEFSHGPLPLHSPVAALQVQIQHSKKLCENAFLCVCVCVLCVYVGVYAHMCVMTEKLFFIMGWRSFTRKTGLHVWIILHHLIHKRLHLVMLPIVT